MRTVFAAASLFVMASASVAFAGQQDFTLENRTGYAISEVYVSPSNTTDWEEDVMGTDVLGDGEQVEIQFSRDTDACAYDLKVTYSDGEEAVWNGFDLCTVSSIRIFYDAKSGETSAEYQ
jgi:hypothetical protein